MEEDTPKPGALKGSSLKKAVTEAAASAAPEEVQQGIQAAQKASALASAVSSAASTVSATVSTVAAVVTNPATWIAAVVVVVLSVAGLAGLSVKETVGRNENADGCYGIPGGESGFTPDDGADWTKRANQMGSWLMSQKWDFLGGKGMTREQAGGIVGNFIKEAGVDPSRAQHHDGNEDGHLDNMSNAQALAWTARGPNGLGMAQWTWNPGRARNLIDLAESMGKSWYDMEVQLTMIKQEVDKGPYGASLLAQGFSDESKDAGQLAVIFHDVYEGSADADGGAARAELAKDFLKKFNGGSLALAAGSSGRSCIRGTGFDASRVVQLAISIASPTYEESVVPDGDEYGIATAPKAYVEAKAKAQEVGGPDGIPNLYASCDRFVATVIKNTVDPAIPWGSTTEQYAYLHSSPKWQEYYSKSEAQPGDIWVTQQNGHIVLYVGNVDGVDSIAHASYEVRVGAVSEASFISDDLVDTLGRRYSGFRFVG